MSATATQSASAVRCRLLTPRGMGAIATVRLSGAGCWEFACRMMSSARALPPQPDVGRVHFATLSDQQGPVDDVLVAARADPYDSSACVDICCHGGRRVVERVLLGLSACGAVVEPHDAEAAGTGWQGHVLRTVDLALAEARTERGALFLLAQRTQLLAAFAEILSSVDAGNVSAARRKLRALLDASQSAHRLIRPAEVVLVGAPNVGKSSLANRLGGREGAIVAERAGTTRDWVSVDTAFRGVPVTLIDTAGRRLVTDELEQQAITAGVRRAASADLVVQVVDATGAADDRHTALHRDQPRRPDLWVLNKIDLVDGEAAVRSFDIDEDEVVRVSARTGAGIDELQDTLLSRLGIAADERRDGDPAVFDLPMRAHLAAHLATAEGSPEQEHGAIVRAVFGK